MFLICSYELNISFALKNATGVPVTGEQESGVTESHLFNPEHAVITLFNPSNGVPEIGLCDPSIGVTEINLSNPILGVRESPMNIK